MMGSRTFLAIFVALVTAASQVEAQDQTCQNNCVKTYNGCIAQCGGTRAAMPWEPVARDKLAKINDCVSSQCRNPLNTCRSDCSKSGADVKRK